MYGLVRRRTRAVSRERPDWILPIVTITNVVGEVRVKPRRCRRIVDVAATKYASNSDELANIEIVARPPNGGGVTVETQYRGERGGRRSLRHHSCRATRRCA